MSARHDFSKPFTNIAAVFLGLVATTHLLRALNGWTIVIEDWPLPAWWSGVAAVALFTLAAIVWREARR